jgi:CBS domain-containing protein
LPKRGGTSADFLNQRLHIEQLMRQPPITVAANQSVEQATTLMTKHAELAHVARESDHQG